MNAIESRLNNYAHVCARAGRGAGFISEMTEARVQVDQAIEQAMAAILQADRAQRQAEPQAKADIIKDLLHSAHTDGYTSEQQAFIRAIADRVDWLDAPPPAQAPLTDEQIDDIRFAIVASHHTERDRKLTRAIEAAHGIR